MSDMVVLPGGTFSMGCEEFYPEECPVRRVFVAPFRIDREPVTNERFGRFVAATGYLTLAERPVDPAAYPDADPVLVRPGSAVFRRPNRRVSLRDAAAWWSYVPGTSWRHPEGPGSDLRGRERHPVVHVGLEDAQAFATWAGKALPTEAEWEYAARGGLDGARYAWGEEFAPDGRTMANTWVGEFPWRSARPPGTTPVGSFPPNAYGLLDMIGNVWEWTADPYVSGSGHRFGGSGCCTPAASAPAVAAASAPVACGEDVARVIKGGSHLCAPNYCRRYRPAARQPQTPDTSTSHTGFRCVTRD